MTFTLGWPSELELHLSHAEQSHCVSGLTLNVPDSTLHSQMAETMLQQLVRLKPSAINILGSSTDFFFNYYFLGKPFQMANQQLFVCHLLMHCLDLWGWEGYISTFNPSNFLMLSCTNVYSNLALAFHKYANCLSDWTGCMHLKLCWQPTEKRHSQLKHEQDVYILFP